MSVIERKATFLFSSNPSDGAQNIQSNGSVFTVNLQYPINLPHSTQYATLEVSRARVWYVTPNISSSRKNNRINISDGVNEYAITINDGLYNLPQLINAIGIQFDTQTLPVVPAFRFVDMFRFDADNATQKVAITSLLANVYINWNVVDSVRDVFGFVNLPLLPLQNQTPPVVPIAPPQTFLANAEAQFNTINEFYISSTIVHTGIPTNSRSSNLITTVPIDVPPGSQINYKPEVPLLIDAMELMGGQKTSFTFSLTDENFIPVDTFGEYWSVTMTLRYWI